LVSCDPVAVAALAEYLHLDRIAGPYFQRIKGIGRQARARKAGTELAHWVPSLSYICLVNSGNAAPKSDRSTVFAAKTEAA
jgi:hypothetical protein